MKIVAYNNNLKDQVVHFIQKIWIELGRTWEPGGREKDLFIIPQVYQESGGEFWVVLNDKDAVVGTVALKPLGDGVCELGRLYLDTAFRGKGVGYDLVQLVVRRTKELGFKTIKLDTSKKLINAYSLFKRLGFKETRQDFDDEDSVFMELDLAEK